MSVDRDEDSFTSSADESPALDAVIAEARVHLDAPVGDTDWSALETRLMQAVEAERRVVKRPLARVGVAAAATLAVAASVVLVLHRGDGGRVVSQRTPAADRVERSPAGALKATEGAGSVRVGAVVAAPGHVLRAGDSIEAARARGVFERQGKVSWLIEDDGAEGAARARVESAEDAFILALEHGAIEAQVVPVASGEAFAIDIATERSVVRVAVHGTHLRVARADRRVVVDLTEGVVAIGAAPRAGMTVGTTVTAPAHVELDATDLSTLRIDHAPGSVRPAVPLGSDAHRAGASAAAAAPTAAVPPAHGATAGRDLHPAAPARAELPHGASSARGAIASSVRRCANSHTRSAEVQVTVSSTLTLQVSAAGAVESARFAPPLSPEVQSCAAEAIYKVKLDEPGVVTIPIEFSY